MFYKTTTFRLWLNLIVKSKNVSKLQFVNTERKIRLEQEIGARSQTPKIKPSIVNLQCVVYSFTCDLCDADYVGYTARHLHQRIAEHKNSAIGRHFLEAHGNNNLLRESQFTVLRKCQSKFDCLVFEMLFIKKLKPNLNIQTDSIRAKLFV